MVDGVFAGLGDGADDRNLAGGELADPHADARGLEDVLHDERLFDEALDFLDGAVDDAERSDGREGNDAGFGDAEFQGFGLLLFFPLENGDGEHVVGADLVFLVAEG